MKRFFLIVPALLATVSSIAFADTCEELIRRARRLDSLSVIADCDTVLDANDHGRIAEPYQVTSARACLYRGTSGGPQSLSVGVYGPMEIRYSANDAGNYAFEGFVTPAALGKDEAFRSSPAEISYRQHSDFQPGRVTEVAYSAACKELTYVEWTKHGFLGSWKAGVSILLRCR